MHSHAPTAAQYPALTSRRHHRAAILRNCPHQACVLLIQPQDIITGDEILSDSYDIKEIDGIAYEADCSRITVGVDNVGASHCQILFDGSTVLTNVYRYWCQRLS